MLPIMISVGLVLLGLAGYFTYKGIESNRALEQKLAELEEATKLKTELDNQFNQAMTELDNMKGNNEQLNALIEQQKAELATQKSEIGELLKDKKKLDAARKEIGNIKAKVANYIAEIEQLKANNSQLTQANTVLKEETTALANTVQAKVVEQEELNNAKAQLVSEREELTKSVQAGSVIKVKDVHVTGYKLKKNGKTTTREKAKRVDQLKVCFTTVSNDIVQAGKEKFFIRIISPKGETLAIDDLGSGSTQLDKTGEEVQFTQAQEYDYNNDETPICFVWQPSVAFDKGKYQVEIYNKGYVAGKGEFELK